MRKTSISDGCTRFQAFRLVVLPVALPGIATVTILVAISAWGEYFGALIFSNEATKPDYRASLIAGMTSSASRRTVSRSDPFTTARKYCMPASASVW